MARKADEICSFANHQETLWWGSEVEMGLGSTAGFAKAKACSWWESTDTHLSVTQSHLTCSLIICLLVYMFTSTCLCQLSIIIIYYLSTHQSINFIITTSSVIVIISLFIVIIIYHVPVINLHLSTVHPFSCWMHVSHFDILISRLVMKCKGQIWPVKLP